METIIEWRDVLGYEGIYQISSFGCIQNVKTKRILKPGTDKKGYLNISLSKEGKSLTRTIHQLMAEAFLNFKRNGYNGLYVDHIDRNRKNNYISNLRLVTVHENNLNTTKIVSSKYPGVSWDKDLKKWRADIKINKKRKFLGSSKIEEEAAELYALEFNRIKYNF